MSKVWSITYMYIYVWGNHVIYRQGRGKDIGIEISKDLYMSLSSHYTEKMNVSDNVEKLNLIERILYSIAWVTNNAEGFLCPRNDERHTPPYLGSVTLKPFKKYETTPDGKGIWYIWGECKKCCYKKKLVDKPMTLPDIYFPYS